MKLSSSFSFLDLNENGTHEDDEPFGPLPVICRETIADGQVVLVADPSLFINSMNPIDENEIFIYTDEAAFFLGNQVNTNPLQMKEERLFIQEFLKFYNKEILKEKESFHYESLILLA